MVQASPLVQFLIVAFAAWLARQQEGFIEYLKAENRMLKARLGRRRIIFSDAERRLLARHAKAVGRKKLLELDPIASSAMSCGIEPGAAIRGKQPLLIRSSRP
jgi:hypothetical protein